MSNLPKISKEQLRTLNSPLRLEILSSLRLDGPATVAEIGSRLGRDELLLYYHLKKLVSVGLVFASGSKATATKPETVFTAREVGVADSLDLADLDTRREMQRNVGTVVRTAGKEYSAALEQLGNDSYDVCQLARLTTTMSPERREELRVRILELIQWIGQAPSPGGAKYSITLLATPLVGSKADSDSAGDV